MRHKRASSPSLTGRPSKRNRLRILDHPLSRVMTSLLRGAWLGNSRLAWKFSPDRRRVLNLAGAPELIEPARNLEPGFAADIAFIDFAVVADVPDDARGPIPRQPKLL